MELIEIVKDAWGFTGLIPVRVIDVNAFGNLLVEDADGRTWRICPEELSCKIAATTPQEIEKIRSSDDWSMGRLVDLATAAHGRPVEGRCFCLKIPAVLGGKYDVSNIGTVTIAELIAFSGDLASQIKDLPDGAPITFKFLD